MAVNIEQAGGVEQLSWHLEQKQLGICLLSYECLAGCWVGWRPEQSQYWFPADAANLLPPSSFQLLTTNSSLTVFSTIVSTTSGIFLILVSLNSSTPHPTRKRHKKSLPSNYIWQSVTSQVPEVFNPTACNAGPAGRRGTLSSPLWVFFGVNFTLPRNLCALSPQVVTSARSSYNHEIPTGQSAVRPLFNFN